MSTKLVYATITINEALARAWAQHDHGPAFPEGECQEQCRALYKIASNGDVTAAIDWHASRFQHPTDKPSLAPRGWFHRWVGGSNGAGHSPCPAAARRA